MGGIWKRWRKSRQKARGYITEIVNNFIKDFSTT